MHLVSRNLTQHRLLRWLVCRYERKAVTLVGRLQSQNGRDAVVVTPDGTEVKVVMSCPMYTKHVGTWSLCDCFVRVCGVFVRVDFARVCATGVLVGYILFLLFSGACACAGKHTYVCL